MKYLDELKRALRFAVFLAGGIFLGAGVLPWALETDKAQATERLLGTLWGVVGAFAAAVALLFINEILRTKRAEKKAAAAGGKSKKKKK